MSFKCACKFSCTILHHSSKVFLFVCIFFFLMLPLGWRIQVCTVWVWEENKADGFNSRPLTWWKEERKKTQAADTCKERMSSHSEKAAKMEACFLFARSKKSHSEPVQLRSVYPLIPHAALWLMFSVRPSTLRAPPAEPNRHLIVWLKWSINPSRRQRVCVRLGAAYWTVNIQAPGW